MSRYLVERTFTHGLAIAVDDDGATTVRAAIDGNAGHGVTWIHSYVKADGTATFCMYDGPNPEAVRMAAETTGLPVNRITGVRVLDPYFYH